LYFANSDSNANFKDIAHVFATWTTPNNLILYGKLKGRLLNVFFVLIFYFWVQFFGFNSKQARIDYR
jgi:hypothetical protein